MIYRVIIHIYVSINCQFLYILKKKKIFLFIIIIIEYKKVKFCIHVRFSAEIPFLLWKVLFTLCYY